MKSIFHRKNPRNYWPSFQRVVTKQQSFVERLFLLKTDEGKTDAEISQALYISEQTVRRMRIRYSEAH
ncbi:MAG TPA: hypothetical protein DEH25_02880 [Chloroflexi bacterium]|nr:hypothetical protein [Chloroflexota bacterium]HBY07804.1 hypothetical protein [Chloroflexota bacterium]